MNKINEIKQYWKQHYGLSISSKTIVDALFEKGDPDGVFSQFTPIPTDPNEVNHVIKIAQKTHDAIERYRKEVQARTSVNVYNKSIVDEMFKEGRPEKVFNMNG